MVKQRPDWSNGEPQTRFWIGDEGDQSSLALSHEVGTLLFSEGFWEHCRTNVPPGWGPIQFNGPWEGGWIDAAGIDAFIGAVRLWSSRYDEMEDTVSSSWGWDEGDSRTGVEVAPVE